MLDKNILVNNKSNDGVTPMNIDCSGETSLKRSNSAPMINEIAATMSVTATTTPAPPRDAVSPFTNFSNISRSRRFSTSSPTAAAVMAIGPRLAPRVNQLRREECIDVVAGREAAHEKEIHSAIQISQSWEDLTFETESLTFKDSSTESPPLGTSSQVKPDKKHKKVFDTLSLSLSPGSPSCSSPSPTRSGLGQRQCFSPSLHACSVAWKNGSLSPSPTRKAFATRRSLSPISIRPSCLGGAAMKRKFELDENSDRLIQPPIKRAFSLVNPSRAETSTSPFSTLTLNSTGSVGTPESISSVDSPNFSNQLAEESSPASGRMQSDDTSMSDSNSNGIQQVKAMEAETIPSSQENTCDADIR
ncbi:protein FAM122A [Trichogramma pretiosum]|uniref:protein FAM122A n=1 Tax=Trichogramma pretiosum TaxID=7493 RepID=UPI0006C95383|nr:protein FAM122A [Trichogramma pretiosum]